MTKKVAGSVKWRDHDRVIERPTRAQPHSLLTVGAEGGCNRLSGGAHFHPCIPSLWSFFFVRRVPHMAPASLLCLRAGRFFRSRARLQTTAQYPPRKAMT